MHRRKRTGREDPENAKGRRDEHGRETVRGRAIQLARKAREAKGHWNADGFIDWMRDNGGGGLDAQEMEQGRKEASARWEKGGATARIATANTGGMVLDVRAAIKGNRQLEKEAKSTPQGQVRLALQESTELKRLLTMLAKETGCALFQEVNVNEEETQLRQDLRDILSTGEYSTWRVIEAPSQEEGGTRKNSGLLIWYNTEEYEMGWQHKGKYREGRADIMIKGHVMRVAARSRADGAEFDLVNVYMPTEGGASKEKVTSVRQAMETAADEAGKGNREIAFGGDLQAQTRETREIGSRRNFRGPEDEGGEEWLEIFMAEHGYTSTGDEEPTYMTNCRGMCIQTRIDHWLLSEALATASYAEVGGCADGGEEGKRRMGEDGRATSKGHNTLIWRRRTETRAGEIEEGGTEEDWETRQTTKKQMSEAEKEMFKGEEEGRVRSALEEARGAQRREQGQSTGSRAETLLGRGRREIEAIERAHTELHREITGGAGEGNPGRDCKDKVMALEEKRRWNKKQMLQCVRGADTDSRFNQKYEFKTDNKDKNLLTTGMKEALSETPGGPRRKALVRMYSDRMEKAQKECKAELDKEAADPDRLRTRLMKEIGEAGDHRGLIAKAILQAIGRCKASLVGAKSKPRGVAPGMKCIREMAGGNTLYGKGEVIKEIQKQSRHMHKAAGGNGGAVLDIVESMALEGLPHITPFQTRRLEEKGEKEDRETKRRQEEDAAILGLREWRRLRRLGRAKETTIQDYVNMSMALTGLMENLVSGTALDEGIEKFREGQGVGEGGYSGIWLKNSSDSTRDAYKQAIRGVAKDLLMASHELVGAVSEEDRRKAQRRVREAAPRGWTRWIVILLPKPGKPLDQLDKRRDICLQPHGLKLLMNGVKPAYEETGEAVQPASNAGFRKYGSPTQTALQLGLMRETAMAQERAWYCGFCDKKGFFMSVVRRIQKVAEAKSNVRTQITDIIMALHESLIVAYDSGEGVTLGTEGKKGNGQGDTLGPIRSMEPLAFEIRAVEWLTKGFGMQGPKEIGRDRIAQIYFADDQAMCTESWRMMQVAYTVMSMMSRALRFEIGVEMELKEGEPVTKTGVMGAIWVDGRIREVEADTHIQLIDGTPIPMVKGWYKHVGYIQEALGGFGKHRDRVVTQCKGIIGAVARLGLLSADQFIEVVDIATTTMIAYYGAAIPLGRETCEGIDRAKRKALAQLGHRGYTTSRYLAHAPKPEGLGMAISWAHAAAALVTEVDKAAKERPGHPSRVIVASRWAEVAWGHCWRPTEGNKTPGGWNPSREIAEEAMGEESIIEAYFKYTHMAGLERRAARGDNGRDAFAERYKPTPRREESSGKVYEGREGRRYSWRLAALGWVWWDMAFGGVDENGHGTTRSATEMGRRIGRIEGKLDEEGIREGAKFSTAERKEYIEIIADMTDKERRRIRNMKGNASEREPEPVMRAVLEASPGGETTPKGKAILEYLVEWDDGGKTWERQDTIKEHYKSWDATHRRNRGKNLIESRKRSEAKLEEAGGGTAQDILMASLSKETSSIWLATKCDMEINEGEEEEMMKESKEWGVESIDEKMTRLTKVNEGLRREYLGNARRAAQKARLELTEAIEANHEAEGRENEECAESVRIWEVAEAQEAEAQSQGDADWIGTPQGLQEGGAVHRARDWARAAHRMREAAEECELKEAEERAAETAEERIKGRGSERETAEAEAHVLVMRARTATREMTERVVEWAKRQEEWEDGHMQNVEGAGAAWENVRTTQTRQYEPSWRIERYLGKMVTNEETGEGETKKEKKVIALGISGKDKVRMAEMHADMLPPIDEDGNTEDEEGEGWDYCAKEGGILQWKGGEASGTVREGTPGRGGRGRMNGKERLEHREERRNAVWIRQAHNAQRGGTRTSADTEGEIERDRENAPEKSGWEQRRRIEDREAKDDTREETYEAYEGGGADIDIADEAEILEAEWKRDTQMREQWEREQAEWAEMQADEDQERAIEDREGGEGPPEKNKSTPEAGKHKREKEREKTKRYASVEYYEDQTKNMKRRIAHCPIMAVSARHRDMEQEKPGTISDKGVPIGMEDRERQTIDTRKTREAARKIQRIVKRNNITIIVATDGSADEHIAEFDTPIGGGTQAAAWGSWDGSKAEGGALPGGTTNHIAELVAIERTLATKRAGDRILLLIDCESAINACEDTWRTGKIGQGSNAYQKVGGGLLETIQQHRMRISGRDREGNMGGVTMMWIKAHGGGVTANVYADAAAKSHLGQEPEDVPLEQHLERAYVYTKDGWAVKADRPLRRMVINNLTTRMLKELKEDGKESKRGDKNMIIGAGDKRIMLAMTNEKGAGSNDTPSDTGRSQRLRGDDIRGWEMGRTMGIGERESGGEEEEGEEPEEKERITGNCTLCGKILGGAWHAMECIGRPGGKPPPGKDKMKTALGEAKGEIPEREYKELETDTTTDWWRTARDRTSGWRPGETVKSQGAWNGEFSLKRIQRGGCKNSEETLLGLRDHQPGCSMAKWCIKAVETAARQAGRKGRAEKTPNCPLMEAGEAIKENKRKKGKGYAVPDMKGIKITLRGENNEKARRQYRPSSRTMGVKAIWTTIGQLKGQQNSVTGGIQDGRSMDGGEDAWYRKGAADTQKPYIGGRWDFLQGTGAVGRKHKEMMLVDEEGGAYEIIDPTMWHWQVRYRIRIENRHGEKIRVLIQATADKGQVKTSVTTMWETLGGKVDMGSREKKHREVITMKEKGEGIDRGTRGLFWIHGWKGSRRRPSEMQEALTRAQLALEHASRRALEIGRLGRARGGGQRIIYVQKGMGRAGWDALRTVASGAIPRMNQAERKASHSEYKEAKEQEAEAEKNRGEDTWGREAEDAASELGMKEGMGKKEREKHMLEIFREIREEGTPTNGRIERAREARRTVEKSIRDEQEKEGGMEKVKSRWDRIAQRLQEVSVGIFAHTEWYDKEVRRKLGKWAANKNTTIAKLAEEKKRKTREAREARKEEAFTEAAEAIRAEDTMYRRDRITRQRKQADRQDELSRANIRIALTTDWDEMMRQHELRIPNAFWGKEWEASREYTAGGIIGQETQDTYEVATDECPITLTLAQICGDATMGIDKDMRVRWIRMGDETAGEDDTDDAEGDGQARQDDENARIRRKVREARRDVKELMRSAEAATREARREEKRMWRGPKTGNNRHAGGTALGPVARAGFRNAIGVWEEGGGFWEGEEDAKREEQCTQARANEAEADEAMSRSRRMGTQAGEKRKEREEEAILERLQRRKEERRKANIGGHGNKRHKAKGDRAAEREMEKGRIVTGIADALETIRISASELKREERKDIIRMIISETEQAISRETGPALEWEEKIRDMIEKATLDTQRGEEDTRKEEQDTRIATGYETEDSSQGREERDGNRVTEDTDTAGTETGQQRTLEEGRPHIEAGEQEQQRGQRLHERGQRQRQQEGTKHREQQLERRDRFEEQQQKRRRRQQDRQQDQQPDQTEQSKAEQRREAEQREAEFQLFIGGQEQWVRDRDRGLQQTQQQTQQQTEHTEAVQMQIQQQQRRQEQWVQDRDREQQQTQQQALQQQALRQQALQIQIRQQLRKRQPDGQIRTTDAGTEERRERGRIETTAGGNVEREEDGGGLGANLCGGEDVEMADTEGQRDSRAEQGKHRFKEKARRGGKQQDSRAVRKRQSIRETQNRDR